MMPSRASLLLYVVFAVLLLALAVLAWWLFSGRKGGRAEGAEGLASQFRVTRVQEADGALWVGEHASGRFAELGRVTRIDPSGELAQHRIDTRVELVAASGAVALVRVRGALHGITPPSTELVRITSGSAFAGFDPRGDFVLERDDRTLVTLSRATLAPMEAPSDDPELHLASDACEWTRTMTVGERTLRLAPEARGRYWLEDERGERLGGPFLDASFVALPRTRTSPLGRDAALISHRLPDQRSALAHVAAKGGDVEVQPGERWLDTSVAPGRVPACAPGLLLLVDADSSGATVVHVAPDRAPRTKRLAETQATLHQQ